MNQDVEEFLMEGDHHAENVGYCDAEQAYISGDPADGVWIALRYYRDRYFNTGFDMRVSGLSLGI